MRKGEHMKNCDRPVVKLVNSSYQPVKAELEEDMSIDATPEDLARAVMRRVKINYANPPQRKRKKPAKC